MIQSIISFSLRNRFLVLLVTIMLCAWGYRVLQQTPIDAIPDLSDVQVIVKTSYPGQAPKVVEQQVTYPLTTAMLSVPNTTAVRGYSFFGDSYVYVIFKEGTDIYWARSRVLEYLNQVASRLPQGAKTELGPDATGVGWVYSYALLDRTGQHDLADLKSIQDWFLKYELQTVEGVAEVASVGGMTKQYQIVVDPEKLRAYDMPLAHITQALQRANQESGASVVEMAEAEYMVRTSGYLQSEQDILQIPLGLSANGVPLYLSDIAHVQTGPQMRRGIAELDGEGEVVGGIIVMRFAENAQATIDRVKQKLTELKRSLPDGVEIVTTYDRSKLISAAVENLYEKLIEEFLVVVVICALFLFHLRSSLVVMVSLPIGILVAFVVMYQQGINANIMSLGGIAIAIGAMVDGAIVMIENVHKHMERTELTAQNRWQVIGAASREVGPPLFFSLLIVTMSFLPVFALEAQEGKLFSPLAFTKTYAMAASAGLAITLVPVLMGLFIRGRIIPEQKNPLNRLLIWLYMPLLKGVLRVPKLIIVLTIAALGVGFWPVTQIGSEFMPPLDEGDLMYMPTTYAGISIGKARQLLQQTDKLIKTVPEVERVFGKIGRAETATDPAPLTMIETFITLKPKSQWREGMTSAKLRQELDALVQFPGVTNAWVMPIKTRIDMLATGIKTPVGIKVAGPDLKVIEQIGKQLEEILAKVPGTASVYSERVAGGRYLKVDIDRQKAARYGLNIADIQDVVRTAIGGMNVSETVEGLERYPINIRYPQQYRDSVYALQQMPIVTPQKQRIALSDVADIYVDDGAPAIKSENARPNGWTYIDIDGRDLGSYVEEAQAVVAEQLQIPAGYALNWSGQYEYWLRAKDKLSYVVPLTLGIILILLYLNFRNISEVLLIMGTMPVALLGGVWFIYWHQFNFSVAVGIGFIALAGLSVEIAVLMMVYLNNALRDVQQRYPGPLTKAHLREAVLEGAGSRLRPIMMTFATVICGLLPIMFDDGTGSEIMQRIAAPMVGGMVSTLVLKLVILPAFYYEWKAWRLKT